MIQKGTDFFKEQSKRRLVMDNELKQINFLDSRVYKRKEDLYYPSVTTILQYMPKNKFFEQWIKDVGQNADIIMRRAGKEGTAVHNAIEQLLKGEELEWIDEYGNARYNELVWGMIIKFKEFWDMMKPELISVEEFVFSDEYQYAGTSDLVCRIGKETWLIDFKTSNTLQRTYDLQLASYTKAWEEMGKGKIDRTGILWLKASTRTKNKKKMQGKGWQLKQIDHIDENFGIFQTIYKLYKLDNPKIQPIYKEYPTVLKL